MIRHIRTAAVITASFFMCCMGGLVGTWMTKSSYPVSVLERTVLTTQVKPGDPMKAALHVDRREQCPTRVQRYLAYSDGTRTPMTQDYESGFGPLGGDRYILRIPTSVAAPHGPAYVWSRGYASCNPIEWLPGMASESDVMVDRFLIGPETIERPVPPGFERMAERAAQMHAGP